MEVLIITNPDDPDSVFVQEALHQAGVSATLWFPSNTPIQQYNTFNISNESGLNWKVKDKHMEFIGDFNTVWLRRPRKPILPNNIHESDLRMVQDENMDFFKLLLGSLCPKAFWVNNINSIYFCKSKIKQLDVARKFGLSIPNTILTNSPEAIREFINSSNDEVIYKPLQSYYWAEDKGIRISYTNVVNIANLPSDDILKLTPGIFQEKIKKSYELRITYFGTNPVSVKLLSQEHQKGINDWRNIPTDELLIERTDLPDSLNQKCIKLLKYFGLKMGCFDFIVTPDNEYIFLEVNEQGQFLWIEEIDNQIPMLDMFVKFLLNRNFEYSYNDYKPTYTLNSIRETVGKNLRENIKENQKIKY